MVVLRHLRVSVTHPPTATAQPAAAAMPGRRCPFSLETDSRAASSTPPHRTRVRQGMLRCRIRPRCCVSHLPSVHGDDVVHLVGALARTLGVEGVVETRLVERGDLGLQSSTQHSTGMSEKPAHIHRLCRAPYCTHAPTPAVPRQDRCLANCLQRAGPGVQSRGAQHTLHSVVRAARTAGPRRPAAASSLHFRAP